MSDKNQSQVLQGGEFVVKESQAKDTFIPEEFNEEQQMVKGMVVDFLETEVLPNIDKIEKQENNIAATLLEKAADLGLLGAHMPEQYGGMEMDTNTVTLIGEYLGPAGSWIVSFAAHTGIGMLPILYFGNEAQKATYLPELISGQKKPLTV